MAIFKHHQVTPNSLIVNKCETKKERAKWIIKSDTRFTYLKDKIQIQGNLKHKAEWITNTTMKQHKRTSLQEMELHTLIHEKSLYMKRRKF